METFYKAFTNFILGTILVIGSILFRGYLLSTFWEWFIIPIFDVETISILQAIGLSMVIGLFTYKRQKESTCTKEDEYWFTGILTVMFNYLIIWFMGWILTLFI